MAMTQGAPAPSGADLLQARYGGDAASAAGKLNEVLRCLFAHRTVRASTGPAAYSRAWTR